VVRQGDRLQLLHFECRQSSLEFQKQVQTYLEGIKSSHIHVYCTQSLRVATSSWQIIPVSASNQAVVSKSQGKRHQAALDTHFHVCEILMLEPQREQDCGLAVGEGGRQLFQEVEAREGGN
jgi:hypothetical protein